MLMGYHLQRYYTKEPRRNSSISRPNTGFEATLDHYGPCQTGMEAPDVGKLYLLIQYNLNW